jgi:sugar (pentulose or hexulose) kinase
MRRHSDWIGERPRTVLVTGGASGNRGILQVIADVFQAELRALAVKNSSALGGALRAAAALGKDQPEALFSRFCAPDPNVRVTPGAGTESVYAELGARFAEKLGELPQS